MNLNFHYSWVHIFQWKIIKKNKKQKNKAQCLKVTQNVAFEFSILAFSTNFVLLKVTCLVTLFDRKLQVFQKLIIFGIFNERLSTQNVNVAP